MDGAGKTRFVAAVGDADDPITWSGIPYHFLQAGRAQGVLDEGLPLSVGGWRWRARRWTWNALRLLSGDRYGGYQYSVAFLEALWRPCRERVRGAVVVNCFQLYPPSVVADPSVEKWFFIDQTLLQLFDHYGQRAVVGRSIAREAIARERDGYHAACGVLVHSRWAAASVVGDYGVPADKVHVVVPGANLHPEAYDRWERERMAAGGDGATSGDATGPLRLVFVGKDWRRKGLDRLLRALALARRDGCNVTLRVIGCHRESLPPDLRDISGVEWCGFVDKRSDPDRFIRLVAEADVGCLLSRAEAGGIALREYHALGLAVLGTTAGGAPEHASPEARWLVPPEASDGAVAAVLVQLSQDRAGVARPKAVAWEQRRSFLYGAAIARVAELLESGSERREPGSVRSAV